uniref:Nucleoside phosphorylase domain-containing protein n=1 Tax=Amphimedon queenslandica TaxID=400682 RepID=A0A1X7UIE6_AMPQE
MTDLIEMQGTASTKLHLVFQRWFDADRDVNLDTLLKLCDDFPDQLGKAKPNLLAYSDTTNHGKGDTTNHGESDTTNHGEGDTTNHGEGDTTNHGKGDTTNHGESDTTNHGKGDTTNHGESDTTNHGEGDTTNHGQSDTTNHGEGDTTNHGESDTTNHGEGDTTNHGESDTTNHGILEQWCKEGIMKLTLTRVHMVGLAGSGKTCVQHLLLNEDSPHTTDSISIAHKAVNALRIAFDDGTETWKRITRDELLKKLASSLKESYSQLSQQIDSQSTKWIIDLKETQGVYKEIADLIPIAAEAQLSEKWVYIVDSGGQPAIQELLPLFTKAATLNVITLDISKDIDQEFEFMYRINGREFPCDRGMKYSNRKIFNSVVSSASVQKPIDIPFVKPQSKHSMSFVLGTHYDVLIERTNKKDAETKVAEMSEKLVLGLPHLKNRIISKVHGHSIIFPVNTMEKNSVKRKKISREILEKMSKCTEVTIEVEVPIRCFAFELSLEEKAKGKGFVTKKEAIEEGKKLYMNDYDIDLALTFLHTTTIILYYPEIQPQLVFISPQKILDVLSHLLALTYVDYPTAQSLATNVTELEMRHLKKKGYFKKVLLMKFSDVFLDNFTPDYFINLLQHLHIITELKNQVGDNSYFLPSALPAYNNEYDNDLPESIKPLYYVWLEQEDQWEPKKSVHVPQGIFPLIFVHLLDQREYTVKFTQDSMYCDAVSLWIYIKGKRYTLYIINRYEHIEVYFDGRQEYFPKNYCQKIRELITIAIYKSSDAINVKQNCVKAFPCPNEEKHCYCVVDEKHQAANCLLCKSNDISKNDKTYWCWFRLGFEEEWLEKADDVNNKGGAKWSTLVEALEECDQNSTADYIKKNSDEPQDVSKYCLKLEDIEKKSDTKFFSQLTPKEKEFIKKVNIILVTATPIEYRAVMSATEPWAGGDGKDKSGVQAGDDGKKYIKVITEDKSAHFILGKFGPYYVAVIRTGQGPDKTDETLTAVQKVVEAKYVIAIGICYGAKKSKTEELDDKTKELGDKTNLGDIIVAECIVNTEHQCMDEKRIVLPKIYQCGDKLLKLFKHEEVFKFESKSVKVHTGVLASEFTLQRNEEEKQKTLNQVSHVLGGEMEANGIIRVARRKKFEWIVVKAIVDWGNEDKSKSWQKFAAVLCVRFVLKCLEDIKQPDEGDVELNPGPTTGTLGGGNNCLIHIIYYIDKELNMTAVIKIFRFSDDHYKLIGTGLGIDVSDDSDLKPKSETETENLITVFQRWFDADKDVNWDTLIKLCDDFPDQLGTAKSNLLKYTRRQCIDKKFTKLTPKEKESFKEVHVILVTATPMEFSTVMGATDPPKYPCGDDKYYIKVITEDESAHFILAKFGPCNVAVIMTGEGPDKTDEVLTSVQKTVKADFVIAIGICYGAKESKEKELSDKTNLCDIIVAESIVNTEYQRSETTRKVLPYTYQCGEKLLNLFKHKEVFEFESKSVKVHVGALASEFTLHCNEEEKQKRLEYIPQVLGGEMEANGIIRVARREEFEWIVIKAIVDWGDEAKEVNWEPFGAVLCARFVRQCLEDNKTPDGGDPLKELSSKHSKTSLN